MNQITPPSPSSQGGNILLAPARIQFKGIFDPCVGIAAEGATLGEYDQAVITSGIDLADPVKRLAMEKMSACLLFMREVMRRSSMRSPILDAAYAIARAEEDVLELARAANALRGPDYVPLEGDGVIIDAPTHGFWVSSRSANGSIYRTVQGGERTADGAECISAIDRPYVIGMHGASFGNRPVKYVLDCIALSAAGSSW